MTPACRLPAVCDRKRGGVWRNTAIQGGGLVRPWEPSEQLLACLMELDELTPAQWEALLRAVFPPVPAADRQGGFDTTPLGGTEMDRNRPGGTGRDLTE